MKVAGPPGVLPLLVLAALVARVDAACACSVADCNDPAGYDSTCVVAVAGDLKVIGDQYEEGCARRNDQGDPDPIDAVVLGPGVVGDPGGECGTV